MDFFMATVEGLIRGRCCAASTHTRILQQVALSGRGAPSRTSTAIRPEYLAHANNRFGSWITSVIDKGAF